MVIKIKDSVIYTIMYIIHIYFYLKSMSIGLFEGERRFNDLYYLSIIELIVSMITTCSKNVFEESQNKSNDTGIVRGILFDLLLILLLFQRLFGAPISDSVIAYTFLLLHYVVLSSKTPNDTFPISVFFIGLFLFCWFFSNCNKFEPIEYKVFKWLNDDLFFVNFKCNLYLNALIYVVPIPIYILCAFSAVLLKKYIIIY